MVIVGVSVELPETIVRILIERARAEGRPWEDLVVSSIIERLRIEDPDTRAGIYLEMCRRFLREAEKKLAEGDYVQASEKGWGAAAEVIKALAAKEGLELKSHRDLHAYVAKIIQRLGDEELRRLWAAANELHRNFYENWLPPDLVRGYLEDVKQLVHTLERLLKH